MSIGGMSSRGLITAVLPHFSRDCSPPIDLKLQLMIVLATDMRYVPMSIDTAESLATESCAYPSAMFFFDLPWSPLARESWFLDYYIGTDPVMRARTLSDWRMTPVFSPGMEGLAPAHIITADSDIERDEGIYYETCCERPGIK